ncbi:ATP-binding protein [Lichenicoccus roseus]|uniref:Uncharacterized protein n=1 Tax=Lichenicoccus roseus TaxID=2683649 RepID=A0A5R9J8E0_9PROT|nr:hypothetical protein [Lichenicoccus roseus]TLU73852.1 hypothetical protein FE263_01035 [Lichenicoccus roseus]
MTPDRSAEDQALIDALTTRATTAEQALVQRDATMSKLRHDLRGILSPAMLMADRLSGSVDPIARRTAETLIKTIERADAALKATRQT